MVLPGFTVFARKRKNNYSFAYGGIPKWSVRNYGNANVTARVLPMQGTCPESPAYWWDPPGVPSNEGCKWRKVGGRDYCECLALRWNYLGERESRDCAGFTYKPPLQVQEKHNVGAVNWLVAQILPAHLYMVQIQNQNQNQNAVHRVKQGNAAIRVFAQVKIMITLVDLTVGTVELVEEYVYGTIVATIARDLIVSFIYKLLADFQIVSSSFFSIGGTLPSF